MISYPFECFVIYSGIIARFLSSHDQVTHFITIDENNLEIAPIGCTNNFFPSFKLDDIDPFFIAAESSFFILNFSNIIPIS